MKNLLILVKMQLKEQLNFKRLTVENVKPFQIILSILGSLLKFVMVTGLCMAFIIVTKMVGLFSVANTPIPSTVISIVFTAMLLASTVSCIVGITKSMYYAADNAVLLTLPCMPVQVYLSKLIIFFIFEIKRNLSFIVPLFLAYFITHGYPVFAYPWMLFCILWVSLFTVSIGALFSIPAMWIGNFFRQRRWLQMAGIVMVVAAASVALFFGISLIPENIDLLATWKTTYWEIQDVLTAYARNFSAVYDITLLMLGETEQLVTTFPVFSTFIRFLLLSVSTVVLLVVGLLIVQPLFYKMASTPFEHLKRQVKPKPNKALPSRISAVYKEFLVTFKSTDRMLGNVGVLISVPMLIFLLNKIFLAMNTRDIGDFMIVAFNVLIILLVVLNSNCHAASVYSREGRSSYLIKTQPMKYDLLIVAKLLPEVVFVILSLIATFVVMLITMRLPVGDVVMMVLAIICTYLAHLLYCAELDIMNPQTELYASVGNSEINPNETKATLSAFLIAFLVAGISFLLLLEGSDFTAYIKYLLLAAGILAYRVYVFFKKLKLYYKEKQG